MKLRSLPEYIHRNISLEQLLFTWSSVRDCSMGTKIYSKNSWKCEVRL